MRYINTITIRDFTIIIINKEVNIKKDEAILNNEYIILDGDRLTTSLEVNNKDVEEKNNDTTEIEVLFNDEVIKLYGKN